MLPPKFTLPWTSKAPPVKLMAPSPETVLLATMLTAPAKVVPEPALKAPVTSIGEVMFVVPLPEVVSA